MLATLAFAICAFAGLTHIVTISTVIVRLRRPSRHAPADAAAPLVSILRPICGLENNLDRCIESSFRLAYPNYELIFCAEDETDEAVPLVRRLMATYPDVAATLLIGRDRIGANPKLNNLAKGWKAARADWVILSDSNVVLPADYVEQLWSCWGGKTGLVSTAMVVAEPEGFAAEVECAYMNPYAARWMLVADSFGLAYAHGKTVMLQRKTIEQAGGFAALNQEAADELAATRIVWRAGQRVRLAPKPVHQPIGFRSFTTVVRRQLRWARLRRSGIPFLYAAEFFSCAVIPFAFAAGLAIAGLLSPLALAAYVVAWYGSDLVLTRAAGWPSSWRMPLALLVRDAIMPVIWFLAWFGDQSEWRGHAVSFSKRGQGKRAG